jgi:hypothetical protein
MNTVLSGEGQSEFSGSAHPFWAHPFWAAPSCIEPASRASGPALLERPDAETAEDNLESVT